jgi:hypothetical protein
LTRSPVCGSALSCRRHNVTRDRCKAEVGLSIGSDPARCERCERCEGCNGREKCESAYLLECLVAWGRTRRLELEPFGLDLSSELIALARQRFAGFEDHFYVANAWRSFNSSLGMSWRPVDDWSSVHMAAANATNPQEAPSHLSHPLHPSHPSHPSHRQQDSLRSIARIATRRYLLNALSQAVTVVAERHACCTALIPVRAAYAALK